MQEQRSKRKVRSGKVISARMDKTLVVLVERRFPHPFYRKVVRITKKYKVHDPENKANQGDIVEIMETRPISKEKHWRLIKVIRKAVIVEKNVDQPETAEIQTKSG